MIYAIAQNTMTNPQAMAAYREKAADALARHGGAVVSAAGDPTRIEGKSEMPRIVAILSFPSKEAALAWHSDPELADAHMLRNAAGESNIMLVG